MADLNERKRRLEAGYQYSAMSSLVTTADRRALPRRADETGADIESLVGRIDPKEMGSRVGREPVKKPQLSAQEVIERAEKAAAKPTRQRQSHKDVVEATDELEGLKYRPRTRDTRAVFELMLSATHDVLGDQPQDVIRSATDLILEVLKDEDTTRKDLDKKREIENAIGTVINSQTFQELVSLSGKITDYADESAAANANPDGERREGDIDEDVGVAVVFEDEESDGEAAKNADGEDEDAAMGFEVRGDSDSEEEEDDGPAKLEAADTDANDQSVMIGGAVSKKSSSKSDRLTARSIDGFWLQRLIATVYPDPLEATTKTSDALTLLGSEYNARDLENSLMDLFDYEHFEITKTLVENRERVVWCTRLARADENGRHDIEVAMREKGVGYILQELRSGQAAAGKSDKMDVDSTEVAVPTKANLQPGSLVQPKQVVDLESMIFSQGARLMSNKRCKLPEGSFKRTKKSYEEIHVPEPPKSNEVHKKVPISSLPEWAREAFKGNATLNTIQSKLFPTAFVNDPETNDEPILLCAPTGAGKTNVAMLCMLNEIAKHRDPKTGEIDRDNFKMVYVAPMKALVAEQVGNFSSRLKYLGINVAELTGDRSLTKEQIANTQIIVTTPEKWDVITRKSTDTSYTNLVRLVIIDEIHLLHDDRGPVLEALVARIIRRMEQTQEYVRLVGLSATLPNYEDVARFLRVNTKKGLFYFDSTFRPCPLKQQFVGVTEKRAIMRHQVMNEVCYEKVLEQAQKQNQCLVFVHSRKETAKTAQFLKEKALETETIASFIRPDSASREILQSEAQTIKDAALRELLPFGFAIHHAGLVREDRSTVEELFADGHVQVLVSTATLAWGVNLPAHAVIIKGTQIYNPEKGRWVELSPQDVLQMIGRAGRPQYDTFGESVIITNHSELQYFLSMLNQQLPIESQLVKRLPDNLNAEIVLGNIRNRDEGVAWLGYTYWFQRALESPVLYGITADYKDDDALLIQKRADIIHTAAVALEKSGLLKYDRKTGVMQSTELGRISSYYFISHQSMFDYNKHLKPSIGLIELFRIFSLSEEFKFVPVREDEKQELAKLLDRVPIPVKESIDDPSAKINVLLQAYISQLRLDGFNLLSDMVYVTQSAGRILRALFEICLKRGWASLTYKALELCKMVDKRMWSTMSPLRQFTGIPIDIVRRAERKEYPWYRYFFLDVPELGELLGLPKAGRLVHRLVHQFPLLLLSAHVQPLTRSMLRIELTITPDFEWDADPLVHGTTESFWVIVEDVDGEMILFHEQFYLRQRFANQDHYLTFTVPLMEPTPPNYFITVVSDRWMHSITRLPISFQQLILPAKFPPPTSLLDLQALPVSALHNKAYEKFYSDTGDEPISSFNKIQTQVFQALYTTNDNVLVCAPTGSGKTICAEFAMLKLWSQADGGKCVCIEPFQDVVDARVAAWSKKFGNHNGGKSVVALTGETTSDLRLVNKSDLIVCTPTQWDLISRRWKQRKAVQELSLIIADEIHLIGGEIGPTYEVVMSRARYITAQVEAKTRIVAFGVSVANARDLADWLGVSPQNTFNFSPGARPLPMEVHIQSFNVAHFPSLMIQMAKPAYLAITEWAADRQSIVFVPSRRHCRLSANDLLQYCLADQDPERFLNIEKSDLEPHLERISDEDLKETLRNGIGYYHEGLSKQDKLIVESLYTLGAIQVVVASKDTAWSIPLTAYLVILMGVQTFEGKEHRYVDYPFTEVLQMMGRACRPMEDSSSRCVIMVPQVRKPFFLRFLNEGLPIESHIHLALADHLLSEIAAGTIENKQDAVDWFTWLWCYRRLGQNPNYYGMQGTTHQHMSDFLSQLIEDTLSTLESSKCIAVEDEMDLSALNLGLIASFYQVSSVTLDTFSMSLTDKTKLKGLLEIVSSAVEFEDIPIRHHEDIALRKVYDRVPVKMSTADYTSPNFKTNVLLQAHFSRLQLPGDLASDQTLILTRVIKLLSAAVDVAASEGYLTALKAVDLIQCVVQAVWNTDSPLKQIPHFNTEVVERCQEQSISTVYDLLDMDDKPRQDLLQFNKKQMSDVARFCNSYSSPEVEYEVQEPESLTSDSPIKVNVTLNQDEDFSSEAVAPFYPGKKAANAYLVVSDKSRLLAIKKVPLVQQQVTASLDFSLSKGAHELTLSVLSDSYIGVDTEHEFKVDVQEGAENSESDNDDGSDVEMAS